MVAPQRVLAGMLSVLGMSPLPSPPCGTLRGTDSLSHRTHSEGMKAAAEEEEFYSSGRPSQHLQQGLQGTLGSQSCGCGFHTPSVKRERGGGAGRQLLGQESHLWTSMQHGMSSNEGFP